MRGRGRGAARVLSLADLPIVSLFCGCGGFDEGFRQAGFQTVLAVDWNQVACDTFGHNHPSAHVVRADLADLRPGEIRGLWRDACATSGLGRARPVGVIGGPPCQAFSLANANRRADDYRKHFVLEFGKLVAALHKSYSLDFCVLENVPRLRSRENAAVCNALVKGLERSGFHVAAVELEATEVGVPQRRRRLFVVALSKRRFGSPFSMASCRKPCLQRTVRDARPGP